MDQTEGVIKYKLDYTIAGPLTENLQNLNCWRSLLYGLGGIGQEETRYEGYGFGNLSQRCLLEPSHFIISATQTGHFPELSRDHYVCVEQCDVNQNYVKASGTLKPSSEALTHSMFYQLDSSVNCVIHVHLPELWQFGLAHDYPSTDESVEYGTQAMATEISRLYSMGEFSKGRVLIMKGHQDGVIFFAENADRAGLEFVKFYSTVKNHALVNLA